MVLYFRVPICKFLLAESNFGIWICMFKYFSHFRQAVCDRQPPTGQSSRWLFGDILTLVPQLALTFRAWFSILIFITTFKVSCPAPWTQAHEPGPFLIADLFRKRLVFPYHLTLRLLLVSSLRVLKVLFMPFSFLHECCVHAFDILLLSLWW
jgi:hypothetical protein